MRAPLKRQALEILRRRGVPVDTVLDVGVLVGTPELIAAYPEAKHILFEPVVEFNDRIEANYSLVRHEIVNAAVSDSSGQTPLNTISIIDGMDISHSYMVEDASSPDAKRVVPKISLDDFIASRGLLGPFLLKIDVDGRELSVLQGASETLRRSSIVIVEAQRSELVERVNVVVRHGFEIFDLAEPCYYDSAFWQCDVILLRTDLHNRYFRDLHTDFDYSEYKMFVE